jgi:hypothetical protein
MDGSARAIEVSVFLVVTGSRDWDAPRAIYDTFKSIAGRYPGAAIVVVHGQCDPWRPQGCERVPWLDAAALPEPEQKALRGADWHADRIARWCGYEVRSRPADWGRYPRAAGHIRNAAMCREVAAEEGERWCVPFARPCVKPAHAAAPPHPSHGTAGCIAEARKLGIPIWERGPMAAAISGW